MSEHRNWIGVGIAALAFSFAQPARAATITVFDSQALFLGALSSSQTFDFNAPDGPIASLGTLASISTLGGDAAGRIHENALCGSSGGSVDCFAPVLFSLAPGLTAFGYDNLDFTLDEEAVVTVLFSNGDPAQSFVFDLGGAAVFTPIFFGITSDVDISTIMIYSRDIGSSTIGQRANVMDNVILGQAEVADIPEPASLLLIGSGLIGLVRLRRRA